MKISVCVAFLRGINVNGHRIVKMAALRASIEAVDGFTAVQTWIQIGNLILRSHFTEDQVQAKLQTVLQEGFGLDDVPIMVQSVAQMDQVIAQNPFAAHYEPKRLFVAYLDHSPTADAMEAFRKIDYSPEKYSIRNDLRVIYYVIPDFAKYKLDTALFERKLQVAATSRNWKVTNKVVAMMKAMAQLEEEGNTKQAPQKRERLAKQTRQHGDVESGKRSSTRKSSNSTKGDAKRDTDPRDEEEEKKPIVRRSKRNRKS